MRAALARLETLADAPAGDHAAVYEEVHGALEAALESLAHPAGGA